RAIRDLIAHWIAASKAGDLETVAGLMSDDVVFMVPGGKAFGKAEFMAASQGMKGMDFEGESEVLEIEIIGTRAWCRTHLTVTATPPGGKPVKRSGYTLSILRKNGHGKWVIARDANMLGGG
ncbi:MAG TPA: SgcJ/EcaC family oxidoreductase, partial [Micropepsaceae bacterium]|nr:SgcJ/EcaC family oxidoreductase [Micropepsaceae bacterium]